MLLTIAFGLLLLGLLFCVLVVLGAIYNTLDTVEKQFIQFLETEHTMLQTASQGMQSSLDVLTSAQQTMTILLAGQAVRAGRPN